MVFITFDIILHRNNKNCVAFLHLSVSTSHWFYVTHSTQDHDSTTFCSATIPNFPMDI